MKRPFLNIRPAVWLLIAGLLVLATVSPGWAAFVAVTFLPRKR